MRKRFIPIAIIFFVLGLIAGIFYGYCQLKKARNKKIEQMILSIEYREQNIAFGMSISAAELGYQGYDMVNEEELFVRLEVYNSWNKQQNNGRDEVLLADVEEYLANEYSEDGSLRVYSRPPKIQEYMRWYYDDGNGKVEEYWDGLEKVMIDFYDEYPATDKKTTGNLTIEQLQELINKYNDSTYEINTEIMRGIE